MNQDIAIIIAITSIGITMVAAVFAMMFWVRSESNELRKEQKEDRRDLLQISKNLEITMQAIQQEIKDFHSRLCGIEERKIK